MNRSIRPPGPAIPSAAYCASTRSRTRSTMSWRTSSIPRIPAIARAAASSAESAASAGASGAAAVDRGRAADLVPGLVRGMMTSLTCRERVAHVTSGTGPRVFRHGSRAAVTRHRLRMTDPRLEAARPSLTPLSSGLLSRRTVLRAGALTGGGLVAAALAACAPAVGAPTWTYPPLPAGGAAGSGGPTAPGLPSAAPSDGPTGHSAAPSGSAVPSGAPVVDHDAAALAVVKRFLDGESATLEGPGNQPIRPRLEGSVKVFDMTIDEIHHRLDA